MGTIAGKVVKKAVQKKDYNFLIKNGMEKLFEMGWTLEDIATLADKLHEACRQAQGD